MIAAHVGVLLDSRGSQGARRSCHWWRDPSDHNLQTSWQRDDISTGLRALRVHEILVAAVATSAPDCTNIELLPQRSFSAEAPEETSNHNSHFALSAAPPQLVIDRGRNIASKDPRQLTIPIKKKRTEARSEASRQNPRNILKRSFASRFCLRFLSSPCSPSGQHLRRRKALKARI